MTIKRPVLDPNALYGASQVAAILKVSRGTVYRYLKGHIRKANGRKVFTGQEIMDLWDDFQ